MPFFKPMLQTQNYSFTINTETPFHKCLTISTWCPSSLLYSKMKNKRKTHLKQHCVCQPWSRIPTIASSGIICLFSQWMLFPGLPVLFKSWLEEVTTCAVKLFGEVSCFSFTTLHCSIHKRITHSDCSLSESTSSSHKKLQVSNSISVMKINLLCLDFLFIFLNRLLHCICCNSTISNRPW